MDQPETFGFQYFISEKNGFVVASLVGLIEPTVLSRLEQCSDEILKHEFSKLVLNFRDVSGLTVESIPVLAKLQKLAREKQADLRLCGLRPEIRERLTKAGILRPHEISDNLGTALQSMITAMRRAS